MKSQSIFFTLHLFVFEVCIPCKMGEYKATRGGGMEPPTPHSHLFAEERELGQKDKKGRISNKKSLNNDSKVE